MTLRSLALAAAVSLGLMAPAVDAQQKVTLKFHTFVAPQSNVYKGALVPWMERIEKESGGRIVFEKYPSMQLGGTPLQLYDQARDGVVDVVWTLAGNTPGRFPRVEAFELPFMMTNAEATSKAYWEFTQTCGAGEFKDTQLLTVNVHGPGMIHSRDKPVRTVADLKGMKVRGPTRTITKLLSAIGATPVGMPLPQIPDALSKGVVDAVVVPWEIVTSIKVDELAKSHTEFDIRGGGLYTLAFVTVMNKAKYDALPADLRKIIDANSGMEASGLVGRDHQAGDPIGRKAAEDRKNTIITVSGAELEGFRKAADLVDDDWVKEMNGKGLNGQQLLDCAKGLIRKHTR
jgi:TRAP-type C4-dicarboxylate transport system substrate-binding protein